MQLTGAIIFVVGLVLTMTVIGAIVGIPLLLFGIYRVFKGKRLTIESTYGT